MLAAIIRKAYRKPAPACAGRDDRNHARGRISTQTKQGQPIRKDGLFLLRLCTDSNPRMISIGALGARRRRGFESFSRCQAAARLCLPDKVGLLCVFEKTYVYNLSEKR